MNTPEFEDILGSLEHIVRRAYALGRADALKHAVHVMQSDENSRSPRTLSATEVITGPEKMIAKGGSDTRKMVNLPSRQPDVPWWQRPPRAG